ncbi:MAG: hypothetical protein JNM90_18290 [Burkholderiales bacterium]|nr:hypothetical protein [Burkholderiales bacterium]
MTGDLFAGAAADAGPARPHADCYWVLPGRLIAGEYPGAAAEAETRARLARIAAAGVRHFLDLTEADELAPYHPLLPQVSLGVDRAVTHERWPIIDRGVPGSIAYARRILDRIDALLAVDAVPYVHCWGGVGRTGTVIGCWLVRHGRSGAEALEVIAAHWQTMAKRHRHPRSPETEAQRRFVLDWARHDRPRGG